VEEHLRLEVRAIAFKERTILKAWEKNGVRPMNPDISVDAGFAPSEVSSQCAHLLKGFPSRGSMAADNQYADLSSESESEDANGGLLADHREFGPLEKYEHVSDSI
jgi:hypothetical protein